MINKYEAQLESQVKALCVKNNCLCLKLKPYKAGLPDRIVIRSATKFKKGVLFLELKRDTNQSERPAQAYFKLLFTSMGVPWLTSSDLIDIENYITSDDV
jgi:hypothetical protein